jgi:hypothetical protein
MNMSLHTNRCVFTTLRRVKWTSEGAVPLPTDHHVTRASRTRRASAVTVGRNTSGAQEAQPLNKGLAGSPAAKSGAPGPSALRVEGAECPQWVGSGPYRNVWNGVESDAGTKRFLTWRADTSGSSGLG